MLIGFGVWSKWMSTTRIAFINYQTITLGEIGRANDNPLVKIESLDAEDMAKAKDYDMVFVQAMGLRLTEDQRAELEKAMKDGTPVVSTMITNPDNDFCSVDTAKADRMKAYIDNGGRKNYHNLLSYVRKYIDKKIIYASEPEKVVERVTDCSITLTQTAPTTRTSSLIRCRSTINSLKKKDFGNPMPPPSSSQGVWASPKN